MVKESVSMEVTRQANEYIRQGHKVYILSIGDTHFNLPASIQKKVSSALQEGKTHYTEAVGVPGLRENISAAEFDHAYGPAEILVVPGVKQGLYYFFRAFKGKRIAILEPAWLGYHAICNLCGKEIIRINTKNPDWPEQLERAEFDCILVCTPNNPDGKIYTQEEMGKIMDIATAQNALVALDQIYALYSYDKDVKSILAPLYGKQNVVTFSGFSKAYAATGLRLGYVAVHDAALLKEMNIVNQNTATCAGSLAQYAFIGYQDAAEEVNEFAAYYRENRDLVSRIFPELEEFRPDGGFYYFINLGKFGIRDSGEFCKRILEEEKVALVPGSAYGEGFDSWIRLSYSIDRTELSEGVTILKNYINSKI